MRTVSDATLAQLDAWPVGSAAVAVVDASGAVLGARGDTAEVFALASVTKLLTSYAVLIAVAEGAIALDEPAGPEGATVAHLLAHASGLNFDRPVVVAEPGTRRIYSTAGFDVLGAHLAERTGIPFAEYLHEAVFDPLGMTSSALEGSPGADGRSNVADLARFAAELQAPTLLDRETVRRATTTVAFPGLDGVVPGFGRQRPNDWGLGFEIRDSKSPHWTGARNSPQTFGHFGRSGTFLWVDPLAGLACVCLTDREFDEWAKPLWPTLSDSILADAGPPSDPPPRLLR